MDEGRDSGDGMSTQESNQWYTPVQILDLVREFFFAQNDELKWFDPTCSAASPAAYYANGGYRTGVGGPEDDALSDEAWPLEHLYMNPPYSDPKPFTQRFVKEIRRVKMTSNGLVHGRSGIVLVNSATSTQWWQELIQSANAVCFVSPRIRFLRNRKEGEAAPSAYRGSTGIDLVQPSSPRYESCIIGFGNQRIFRDIFGALGITMRVD